MIAFNLNCNSIFNFLFSFFLFAAYDTLPIPIDSLQGLDLCGPSLVGGPASPYAMDMDVGEIGAGELLEAMPSPPHDNTQAAAWYDTDL